MNSHIEYDNAPNATNVSWPSLSKTVNPPVIFSCLYLPPQNFSGKNNLRKSNVNSALALLTFFGLQ